MTSCWLLDILRLRSLCMYFVLRHLMMFIFSVVYCVCLWNIESQNRNSKKTWLTDQILEYQTGSCFFSIFLNNFWQPSGVVFLNVSIMSPIKVQMPQDLPKFIFDLNWEVRICCELPLHLCVFFGQQKGLNWKDMIGKSNFWAWDHVTGSCLNLTFSNKLLIDSCCL